VPYSPKKREIPTGLTSPGTHLKHLWIHQNGTDDVLVPILGIT